MPRKNAFLVAQSMEHCYKPRDLARDLYAHTDFVLLFWSLSWKIAPACSKVCSKVFSVLFRAVNVCLLLFE